MPNRTIRQIDRNGGRLLAFHRIMRFIRQDLWRIRQQSLSRKKSFFIKQLRVIILTLRGFYEDECGLRASALTLYSLLSIVPVLAMAFGVAKGFAMEKLLENELLEKLKGQEEVLSWIINYANTMLENTKGGLIAGIGVVVLLGLTIKLLSNIEDSFNEIWGVQKSRTFGRKLSDYLSIMIIGPVLLVVSSSIKVFITTQVTLITQKIALLGAFSSLILFFLKLIPYVAIWLLFTFVYLYMPNTKVRFRSGLLGGIVAGTIYGIVQWGYITFQIGVSRYGAIYGSFAALPLFLIWLQISWLVVLFGAEISFAFQNVDTYEFEPDSLKITPSFKKLLALRIAHTCVGNFCKGEKPRTADQISHTLEIPIRLVNLILFELVQCNILSEVIQEEAEMKTYQPARNVDTLSLSSVIQDLDRLGNADIPVLQSEELDKISECLNTFETIINKSDSNLLLKNI